MSLTPPCRTSRWFKVAAASFLLTITAIGPAMSLAIPGGQAPGYNSDLGSLGVQTATKQSLKGKTLADLAGQRKLVIYFWSAQVGKCESELSALSAFRSSEGGEYKILAVAFPVLGDENNSLSRRAAARHADIDIIFDDGRKLYSLYCPSDKSQTRSSFIIDKNGLIERARVGDLRQNDLMDWLGGEHAIPGVPPDVQNHPQLVEIMKSLQLKYMSLPDGVNFKPNATIRAQDFLACVKKVLQLSGLSDYTMNPPDQPAQSITRQQAAKLIACAAFSQADIDTIAGKGGGATLYLSDFLDSRDIAKWAEPYYTASVYQGWLPDRYRLDPLKYATRAYIATMLVRAFPPLDAYTGLIVRVADIRRAQTVQIITDDPATGVKVLYPNEDNLPPVVFLQSPGMVSYCKSEAEAQDRRAGKHPLVVTATSVRIGKGGKQQIVLSTEDAGLVEEADKVGLFLRSWRVAIAMQPRTGG